MVKHSLGFDLKTHGSAEANESIRTHVLQSTLHWNIHIFLPVSIFPYFTIFRIQYEKCNNNASTYICNNNNNNKENRVKMKKMQLH